MALFSCRSALGTKMAMPQIESHTRTLNGNGSGKTAAYTVTISAEDTNNWCLYVIFQFYVSNSTIGGYTTWGTVEETANVDWSRSMSRGQENPNSLVYHAWRCVLVKPLLDSTATKVKFTATTGYGKILYYVYKIDYPFMFPDTGGHKRDFLIRCGRLIEYLKELTGSTVLVERATSTTAAKTISWTAKKGRLYIVVAIFLSNGTSSFTSFVAPTASANVEWLYSMTTGSSSSDSVNARAHKITFVRAAADGTCSIHYNAKTSNGRFYYWVREMSPEVF